MTKYLVKTPIKAGGKRVAPGTVVDLPDDGACELLACKAIEAVPSPASSSPGDSKSPNAGEGGEGPAGGGPSKDEPPPAPIKGAKGSRDSTTERLRG